MSNFPLSEPTAFPDLNKAEGKEPTFERSALTLNTLKYKHFRAVLKFPEEDQMHHLMMALTNLTEDDLGELTPTDAAGISHVIYNSMKKYMELGQTILRSVEK